MATTRLPYVHDPWVEDRLTGHFNATHDRIDVLSERIDDLVREDDTDALDNDQLQRLGINTGDDMNAPHGTITGIDLAEGVRIIGNADTMLAMNTTQGVMRVDSEMVVDGTLDVTGSLMYNGSLIEDQIETRILLETEPLRTRIMELEEQIDNQDDELLRLTARIGRLEENG
jgi:hypothetical protein